MSRHAKIFAALVIGLSSTAMIVASPPSETDNARTYNVEADSTGKGVVTRAQFSQAAIVQFDAADSNSDGLWTAAELRKFQQDRHEQRNAKIVPRVSARELDTNSDGDINEEEARAAGEAVRVGNYAQFEDSVTSAQLEQRMREKLQRLQQGRS